MKTVFRIGLVLLKGIAAAAAAFVGLIASGVITPLLGLPMPEVPPQVEMNLLMPRLFLSMVVIAIVLGECFQRLSRQYWKRFLSIWLCNYLVYYLLNMLDGMLFTPFPNMGTGIISNIFPALTLAAATAWLWKPGKDDIFETGATKAFFAERRPADWAWRFALAWLAYPPIYYLMGLVISPLIKHYYEDPGLNLGLVLPPLGILLGMQVLRGILFLVAVLPVIIVWRGSTKGLWLWTGSIIFIQIAGQIIFQAYWLPLGLRIPHIVELLVDSFLQAGLYAILLGFRSKLPTQEMRSS